MLTFYINRSGKTLPKTQRDRLERAKAELKHQFGRIEFTPSGASDFASARPSLMSQPGRPGSTRKASHARQWRRGQRQGKASGQAFDSAARRTSWLQSSLCLLLIGIIKEHREVSVSKIKLTVNGRAASVDVEDRTLLVHLLRDHLNLTGTHVGCDTSQCGACVVHIDGRAVKSCTVLVGQANGTNVTTIEGLSKGTELHPMQAAFRDNHGLQCGYCTPGMIMSAIDIVHRYGGKLDEETVRHELEGNICRCTGYHNIVKAVLDGAGRMKVLQAAE
jgi:aerobic carbon-monoxide dehydrogenase small subunit